MSAGPSLSNSIYILRRAAKCGCGTLVVTQHTRSPTATPIASMCYRAYWSLYSFISAMATPHRLGASSRAPLAGRLGAWAPPSTLRFVPPLFLITCALPHLPFFFFPFLPFLPFGFLPAAPPLEAGATPASAAAGAAGAVGAEGAAGAAASAAKVEATSAGVAGAPPPVRERGRIRMRAVLRRLPEVRISRAGWSPRLTVERRQHALLL